MRETTLEYDSGIIKTNLKRNYLFSTEHYLIAKNFLELAKANLRSLADFTEYGTVTDLDLCMLLKLKILAIKKSISQKMLDIKMCNEFNKNKYSIGNGLKEKRNNDIINYSKALKQTEEDLASIEYKKPKEIFLIYSNDEVTK
jgi:hypothetical protein